MLGKDSVPPGPRPQDWDTSWEGRGVTTAPPKAANALCRRSPTCVGHSMSFIPFFSRPLRFVLVFPRASSGCLHFVGNTNVGSRVSAGWSPQDPAGAQQKQMSHPGTAWTPAEQDLASLQDHAWRPRPILSSPVQESPCCAGVTPADPPGRVGCTWNLCGREGESHR